MEVRDRVMAMVLVFEEEVIRVKCAYATHVGRSECEKDQFYNKMSCEWNLQNPGEMILCTKGFNRHFGRRVDSYEGVHDEYKIGERNVKEKRLLEFCDKKELHVANTWFEKNEQKKTIYSMGENKTEVDFVLVSTESIRKM